VVNSNLQKAVESNTINYLISRAYVFGCWPQLRLKSWLTAARICFGRRTTMQKKEGAKKCVRQSPVTFNYAAIFHKKSRVHLVSSCSAPEKRPPRMSYCQMCGGTKEAINRHPEAQFSSAQMKNYRNDLKHNITRHAHI